jgi:hypothetical protein
MLQRSAQVSKNDLLGQVILAASASIPEHGAFLLAELQLLAFELILTDGKQLRLSLRFP